MKLKLNPTPAQKVLLARMAGAYRFTYNKAIALRIASGSTHRSPISLQNRLVNLKKQGRKTLNTFVSTRPWLQAVPCNIRKYAVRDACSNLSACFTNLKNGNIKHFSAPFKRKRTELEHGWSLGIEKGRIQRNDTKLCIMPKVFGGEMRYHSTKQLLKLIPDDKPKHDCRIQKDRFGDFYLVVPVDFEPQKRPADLTSVAAVDPGVRKYATLYSPNGDVVMYGHRWATRITELSLAIDKLQSEIKKSASGRRRYHLKQQWIKKRRLVHNLKTEMRYQVANDIVKRHDVILLPKLETKDLVIKSKRKLTTKTVRSLLQAGHGMFFDHLRRKCFERGKVFMQVSEHYTSRTCPCCGSQNRCDEVYRCKACNFRHDRDAVGALNILLRAVR
jgi:transposase